MPNSRWKAGESALDRVWSVGITLSRPRSAKGIADEAEVSERTARRHLARLVEIGMLGEMSEESSVLFRPDPLYTRLRALRNLLDEHDDLEELRSDLEERIEGWQSEYGASSPEELRSMAAHTETADQTRQRRWAANDWETVRYRLGLVEEAIELRASGPVWSDRVSYSIVRTSSRQRTWSKWKRRASSAISGDKVRTESSPRTSFGGFGPP